MEHCLAMLMMCYLGRAQVQDVDVKLCCLLPCKVLYFDPEQQNLEGDQHRQRFTAHSIAPQMHHGYHNLEQDMTSLIKSTNICIFHTAV